MSESRPLADVDDLRRWTGADEGQFFERKSAWDRATGQPRRRRPKDIAYDIAETLSAMANADGGELVVGIENDGSVSGVDFAQDQIRFLLAVPHQRNYVTPPLSCRARLVETGDGQHLLHFEVDWSPDVHQLADGRYLLRVGDRNSPFPAEQIAALKQAKSQGLLERSFPPGGRLEDIDLGLVHSELGGLWPEVSPVDILRRYGLVAWRGSDVVPTLAALLLFGKEPQRWHPRCGIDFVRWEGVERKQGPELNIVKRTRIEAPLAVLIREAYEAIRPHIRERQHLHDLFFTEKLEYPTFAWQEAIVNAVAHRDYAVQGASIEVWMYDDRMEIRSPGLPPAPVTVDALNRRERVHLSRNPLLVRTLADLNYMRDLGEGIPRMFDEMDRAGCYPPQFEAVGGFVLQVTLRNEPIYGRDTVEWLRRFDQVGLSGDQKRILAYAHTHGDRFTSRDYQKIVGTDIYGASSAIRDMIRKGVARPLRKGGRIYQVHEPLRAMMDTPAQISALLPLLQRSGRLTNAHVVRALGVSRITATRLLNQWVAEGWLRREGKRRWTVYYPGERLMHQAPYASNECETDT